MTNLTINVFCQIIRFIKVYQGRTYVCMLAIADKTGGPNGLIFFRDFSSTSGVTKASIFFHNSIF